MRKESRHSRQFRGQVRTQFQVVQHRHDARPQCIYEVTQEANDVKIDLMALVGLLELDSNHIFPTETGPVFLCTLLKQRPDGEWLPVAGEKIPVMRELPYLSDAELARELEFVGLADPR